MERRNRKRQEIKIMENQKNNDDWKDCSIDTFNKTNYGHHPYDLSGPQEI